MKIVNILKWILFIYFVYFFIDFLFFEEQIIISNNISDNNDMNKEFIPEALNKEDDILEEGEEDNLKKKKFNDTDKDGLKSYMLEKYSAYQKLSTPKKIAIIVCLWLAFDILYLAPRKFQHQLIFEGGKDPYTGKHFLTGE